MSNAKGDAVRAAARTGRERLACEFRLIRYVPDVVRAEFVTVGVVLREVNAAAVLVRFARGWSRVRKLDADVDVPMLQALEEELQVRLSEADEDQRPLLEVLDASFSNQVQVTPWRASLAETLPAEMDRLMRLYVDAAPRAARVRDDSRTALLTTMRGAFEKAGVWGLMRKEIRAAEYTGAGDPLRIDCGYRPNGTVRLFQAVVLRGDVEGAKVLAYAAKDLAAGLARKEQVKLELTAIVAPISTLDHAEEAESYRFALQLMEREAIRVMTTNDLPRIAETARREMRL